MQISVLIAARKWRLKTMPELELCPFCGGVAKLKFGKPCQQKQNRRQAFVQCTKCGAKSQTVFQLAYQSWEDTKRYAVALWNRREPHWISVKDRLPKIDDEVLCRSRTGTIDVVSLSWAGTWDDNNSSRFYPATGYITHWMPIPKLPEIDL